MNSISDTSLKISQMNYQLDNQAYSVYASFFNIFICIGIASINIYNVNISIDNLTNIISN